MAKALLRQFWRTIAGWRGREVSGGDGSCSREETELEPTQLDGPTPEQIRRESAAGAEVQKHTVSRGDALKVAAGVAGAAVVANTLAPEALASGSSSNFTTFSSPVRLYGNSSVSGGSVIGPIDATVAGIPPGATAAWCAVQSQQSGVMTLFADGTTDPGVANWTGTGTSGVLNMMYMMVPLSSAGKFWFHTYFTGSVYIDAWGYLS